MKWSWTVNWPPRSPDFILFNYCLWGWMKKLKNTLIFLILNATVRIRYMRLFWKETKKCYTSILTCVLFMIIITIGNSHWNLWFCGLWYLTYIQTITWPIDLFSKLISAEGIHDMSQWLCSDEDSVLRGIMLYPCPGSQMKTIMAVKVCYSYAAEKTIHHFTSCSN